MRIDTHSHHMPEELADRLADISGKPHRLREREPLAARAGANDDAGVDLQIFTPGALQPYYDDRATAVEYARVYNDAMHKSMEAYPGRFGSMAAIPLPHVDAAIDEAARCLDELGCCAVALGTVAGGKPIDDAMFSDLWAELNARKSIVYLHPGVANQLAVGIEEYSIILGSSYGSPAESAVSQARLVLTGITTDYPDITFVQAATGGMVPFGWAKMLHTAGIAKRLGSDNPRFETLGDELKKFWYDTSTLEEPYIPAIRASYGVDRLLLGSDTPLGTPAGAVATITGSESLTKAEQVAILETNPVTAFGL